MWPEVIPQRRYDPNVPRSREPGKEARESLAINYKGKEMAIAFNPKYMIDPLVALPNEEVFLELIDELSPGVFKINGPFLYVVMPMRLS